MGGFAEVLGGAGSIVSGILGYYATKDQIAADEKADEKNYELAQQYRGDVLSQQKVSNDFTQQGLDLSKKRFSFEKDVTNEATRRADIAQLSGRIQQAVQEDQGFKNWLINLKKV